jgi:hypothetical protein
MRDATHLPAQEQDMQKMGRLAALLLAATLISNTGCSRGGGDDAASPASAIPVQQLRAQALQHIAGEASVACDGIREPMRFAVDAAGFSLGDHRLEASVIESLVLGARFDDTLDVQVQAVQDDGPVLWTFMLDPDGMLTEVTADVPDTLGGTASLDCLPTTGAGWSDYRGDAMALVRSVAAPQPSYPAVDMDCDAFLGIHSSGPMRVAYTDHQLSFQSDLAWESYGPIPFWPPEADDRPFLLGVALVSSDQLGFFRAESPERYATIAIDSAGALRAATVSARTTFINCERP